MTSSHSDSAGKCGRCASASAQPSGPAQKRKIPGRPRSRPATQTRRLRPPQSPKIQRTTTTMRTRRRPRTESAAAANSRPQARKIPPAADSFPALDHTGCTQVFRSSGTVDSRIGGSRHRAEHVPGTGSKNNSGMPGRSTPRDRQQSRNKGHLLTSPFLFGIVSVIFEDLFAESGVTKIEDGGTFTQIPQ